MRTVAWMLTFAAMSVGAAVAGEVSLPVTKVTSFNSGVAYYEHNGRISGDAQVQLKFKADQINDILKSLVPLDLSGQGTADVSYASQEPLSRALKSFSVDISGNPSLGALLDQVRGAEVAVSAPDKVVGKILGVETRRQQVLPANLMIDKQYLNLTTSDGIRSIPLDSIAAISLSDPKLNDELSRALALLVDSRDSDRKGVQVNFRGKGDRAVRIGYINEAPVWKTSYRLVLGDENSAGAMADKAGAATRLQGWAILENTSDFDWDNVDLTLVAGRPISFRQDLYTPLYVPRPEVKPEVYASLQPRMYEEGMSVAAAPAAEAAEAKSSMGGRGGRAMAAQMPAVRRSSLPQPLNEAITSFASKYPAEAGYDAGAAIRDGVQSVASGGSMGELFSYHINTHVTLPRRKSAMLPIVNQDVRARKVSIYNRSVLARNPLNGLWLTNDTKLSLLAGPVTVFDGGAYAGDARLDNLAAGENRLLSYAIDLEVTVDPTDQEAEKIAAAKIVRGVLSISRRGQYTQVYAIKNKAGHDRTLVIEHPRQTDRKLISPSEPTEKTPLVYRFETTVAAAKDSKPTETKFTVVEEQVFDTTIGLIDLDIDDVMQYTSNKEISEKVRAALAEAGKRKNDLAEARKKIASTQQQIEAQQRDRSQLPPVMNALDRASQAYKTYEKKLMTIEARLDQLQKDLSEQTDRANELETSLANYLNNLSIE